MSHEPTQCTAANQRPHTRARRRLLVTATVVGLVVGAPWLTGLGAAQTPSAQPTAVPVAPPSRPKLRLGRLALGGGPSASSTGSARPAPSATAQPAPKAPAPPIGTAQPAPSGTSSPAPASSSAPSNSQPAPSGSSQPSSPPPTVSVPATLDICITSAAIAPFKGDGTPWDAGGQKLSEDEQKAFDAGVSNVLKLGVKLASAAGAGSAVAATVTAELIKVFQKPALQALSKPDVFGTAELTPTGSYSSKETRKLAIASRKSPVKEFYASFSTTACFIGASHSKSMRIRVSLTDKDLIDDDRIATVELLEVDVVRAYSVGKSIPVHVGDQDTGQLKFLSLSVTSGDTD